MKKEDVSFGMVLNDKINIMSFRSELEKLAEDLVIDSFLDIENTKLAQCHTNQETYEKVFGCELKYSMYATMGNPSMPTAYHQWDEETPAKIPNELQPYVISVNLARKYPEVDKDFEDL